MLDAAAHLKEQGLKCRFIIAGQPDKGNLYQSLLEQRKAQGLEEQVQFLGFLDNAPEFLANLDLFVSSSISEGLPLSAIQAMAAQLPLLATRCGGYEELVTNKENGWLVNVGDSVALANGISELITQPEIRSELAKKAKKHAVGVFDISVMLEKYQSLY